MTVRALLFCALALSLATISIAWMPQRPAPAAQYSAITALPGHALTGVSFHAVAGF